MNPFPARLPRLSWRSTPDVTGTEALGHRVWIVTLHGLPYRYRLLVSDDRDSPSGRIVVDRYYRSVGGAQAYVRGFLQRLLDDRAQSLSTRTDSKEHR